MAWGIQDLYFVMVLIAVGMIAGYSGGLFGMGGGVVLVPVFVTLFPFFHAESSVVMHNAVGTSLALIIPTTLMSAIKQYKMKNMDFPLLKQWIPFVILGAIIGTAIIKFIPALYLKLFFSVYLYTTFLYVVFRKKPHTEKEGRPHGIAVKIVGVMVGWFSVLLGMGGGAFSVPFTKVYNYPIKKALSFSSTTGVFISMIGTVGAIMSGLGVAGRTPYSLGFVNVVAFIIVAPVVLFCSPYGVRQANAMDKNKLHRLYAGFLLILAIYMTFEIFYDF